MKSAILAFLKSCAGAAVGLAIGLFICKFAGESPMKVLKVLFESSFGSGYAFGMTLFYTAPFILTGLAVAIPFRAGLFNIGAEGQLTMGALGAAAAGTLAPSITSPLLAISFATLLAFFGGGVWGMIPGYLKAKRGSHEVITTIMLNFIAAGISAYFLLYVLKDPNSSQAETTTLPEVYWLKPYAIFDGAPMGHLFWVLILLTLLIWVYLKKSVWGYKLRAIGENEHAAETFGISKNYVWMSSMFVAGGIAGLVGVSEVLGNAHNFKIGFSADYGFVGIAVALVARGNILGIIPSALLFGILQKGSGSLDLETDKITRDLSYIIQGLVILGVASDGIWDWFKLFRKRRSNV
jgi:ABC-type uncharacterized transport system permease subunit